MKTFLDHWENLRQQNTRLRWGFYSVLCVLGLLIWQLGGPVPIFVVPGAATSRVYKPLTTDDPQWQDVVRDFSRSYVLTAANFTPDTAATAYDYALRYLTPEARSQAKSQRQRELERILRDQISSTFSLDGEITVTRQQGQFEATVPGRKRIHAGREEIANAGMAYRLLIIPVPSSPAHPYGLQIARVEQETITTNGKRKH